MATHGHNPASPTHAGGQDRTEAHSTIADDNDRIALPHLGTYRCVVPGGHHVGKGQQGCQHLFGETARTFHSTRNHHQGPVSLGHTQILGLGPHTRLAPEEPAVGTSRFESCLADRAAAATEGEGNDDEIPLTDSGDLVADLFDDAYGLMTQGAAGGDGGQPTVVPEVRTADTGSNNTDHRIGRLLNLRLRNIPDH